MKTMAVSVIKMSVKKVLAVTIISVKSYVPMVELSAINVSVEKMSVQM